MTTRNKSVLIIIGTLILGMVLGALVWSSFHTRRMQQIANLRMSDRLVAFIEKTVEPTDTAQQAAIREVVETHHVSIRELMDQVRDQQATLQSELAEVLTEAQHEKLTKAFGERFRRGRRFEEGGKRKGHRGRSSGWMNRDTNEDGVVDQEEFLAPLREMMTRLDTNGDGVLDAEEMQGARRGRGF